MPFTSRMYARVEDRERIARFLSEASVGEPRPSYWHIGDLTWGLYQNVFFDPTRGVRLWEDATTGALLGFAWLDRGELDTMVAPVLRATPEGNAILAESLAWARRVAARHHLANLWTHALDSDAWQIEQLAAHDFARDEHHDGYVHFRRPFDDAPLPDAPLPEGFSVRAVGGEDEWQRRVDLHRVVYHPSRVTLPAYRRLRAAPLYRHDLDLVAVAPNGEFVSYCILWYDERTRVGEYEPVGAHPDWRRQRITRAVLVEGLRRLRALGARRAIVLTNTSNAPAIRLYESIGFVSHDHERYYKDQRRGG